MAYEQRPNTGIMFINDKKGNDKAPDRRGSFNIDGREYEIAGWQKTGKKGPFLSLSVKPKHRPQSEDVGQQNALDDDLPPF